MLDSNRRSPKHANQHSQQHSRAEPALYSKIPKAQNCSAAFLVTALAACSRYCNVVSLREESQLFSDKNSQNEF